MTDNHPSRSVRTAQTHTRTASSDASSLRRNRKDSLDTHHRFSVPVRPRRNKRENQHAGKKRLTCTQWYWRLLAFFDSFILLAGYNSRRSCHLHRLTCVRLLSVAPLCEKAPNLKVPRTTISILCITSLTLAWSLTPLLYFAVRSPSFRAEAVVIPCLSASLLGLLVLLLNFFLTNRYHWTLPATLGVAASAISMIVYSILFVWTRVQGGRQHKLAAIEISEVEASLLSTAAPPDRSTPPRSPSPASRSPSTLPVAASHQESPWNNPWNSDSGFEVPSRDSSPHAVYYPPSLQASSQRLTQPKHAAIPSPSLDATRPAAGDHARTSRSTFALPHAAGEAPVETLHAPPPSTEDEMMRQQMLRLLVDQTSQQAKRNPGHGTFQIEVPRAMREALMHGSLDDESIGRATQGQVLRQSANPARGRIDAQVGAGHVSSAPSVQPGFHHAPHNNVTRIGRIPLINVQSSPNEAAVSPASVQPTPLSAYAATSWETRDERR